MSDNSKPSMMQLPNGTFLYPHRYRSITAFRAGSPPNLFVVLECLTQDGETEVERIECETWDQVDGVGRVISTAMAEYFPQVRITFSKEEKHG